MTLLKNERKNPVPEKKIRVNGQKANRKQKKIAFAVFVSNISS
jgi:ribosome-associated protein YbcJ (S4-like RNA binding protein)